MNIVFGILIVLGLFFMGFLIGCICGVKAQKREVEKMIHSGVLQFNYKLYEVKEIEK